MAEPIRPDSLDPQESFEVVHTLGQYSCIFGEIFRHSSWPFEWINFQMADHFQE